MMLDLDGFKSVNDTYGHESGDELLRALAPILRGALRPSDTLARFGGDEFAIVAEGIEDHAQLAALAERILAVVAAPISVLGGAQRVTGSLGVTTATPDATVDELLSSADAAMYEAKNDGPGRYRISTPRTATRAAQPAEGQDRPYARAGSVSLPRPPPTP